MYTCALTYTTYDLWILHVLVKFVHQKFVVGLEVGSKAVKEYTAVVQNNMESIAVYMFNT